MDSLRSMRRRIWSALLLASDQEIADGLAFYPGAHGLCRLFALSHPPLTVRHVAGIYAALSPMNTWDTNVANTLDTLRVIRNPQMYDGLFAWGPFKGMTEEQAITTDHKGFDRLVDGIEAGTIKVNTTHSNKSKALRIARGEDPDKVLGGRKVRAFYRSIADPDDTTPIAIDRHLINLALGISAPTKRQQADFAHNDDLYSRIECAYQDLGRREGLGNRLASIAWFVQRRLDRSGQIPHTLASSDLPVCCSTPMWSHGHKPRRFYCPICKSTSRRPIRCLRLVRTRDRGWVRQTSTSGLKIFYNDKGRACVTLHPLHPYANQSGWQYLARFLVAESIGRLPLSSEHIHHVDGDLTNDSIDNLELVSVEYHGKIHASAVFVGRGEDGRFREIDPNNYPPPGGMIVSWPRDRAVLGNQAKQR